MDAPARLTRSEFETRYLAAFGSLRAVAASEVGWDHAEDAVQQAAITAMKQLDRFTPGTNFQAWMAAIVRGAARNMRRSERRRAKRESAVGSEARLRLAGDNDNTDARFDATLRHAMGELAPVQESCLVLKVVMGHSYSEIAAIMDLPEATARSHVHRARRRLADTVREREAEEVHGGRAAGH